MVPVRRFGRTALPMPVLSLGGMRFQQSWSDIPAAEISAASQANLRATLERAVACGLHHIETARHYGSSERQLGHCCRRWSIPIASSRPRCRPRPTLMPLRRSWP